MVCAVCKQLEVRLKSFCLEKHCGWVESGPRNTSHFSQHLGTFIVGSTYVSVWAI